MLKFPLRSWPKRKLAPTQTSATRRQSFELLRRRHQQGRRLVRPYDTGRMRVERHGDGGGAVLAGAAADAVANLAMAAMDAIEVAERQHRFHPVRGARVVGEVNDVHQSKKAQPQRSQGST